MESTMSIAAQAKARAEARRREAVEAAADVARPKQKVVIVPAQSPDRVVPPIRVERISPAARRHAFLVASTSGAILAASGVHLDVEAANDPHLESEAAKTLLMLQDDKRKLKAIQAQSRKIELKRQLVPNYRGWCDGVLAGGRGDRGPLDSIFTTILMWTIDIGDYLTALPMAEHVLRYGLEMPAHVKRTPAVFIVEQIAEAAIAAYDLADPEAEPFPHAVLPMLEDLIVTVDADMPDEVTAKLQKAIGKAIMAGADLEDEEDVRQRQEATLRRYMTAMKLDPRAGVKGEVSKLKKVLGKPEDDLPQDVSAADAVQALASAIEGASAPQNPPSPEGAG
jgi:Phage small terminase subunit